MESLVRDHLMKFFVTNNLFSNYQYGFIKGRSTVLQLLHILDKWTKLLEEGRQVDVIYTDFEKAFDKVRHKRLLSKLRSYGVGEDLIRWIKGFLVNRRHQVRVNSEYSSFMPVTSGIPQDNVLGPLLFVIYINDLPMYIEKFADCSLFADDAKLSRYASNEEDSTHLQKGFCALKEWSDYWLLKLNINKCNVMSLSYSYTIIKYKYSATVDNTIIDLERCNKVMDLGVIVDSKLSFSDHITEKVNKAYSILGIIKQNFQHVDKDAFVLLYKVLVRCHLEYANTVWSPYKQYLTEEVEKVQKRATKLVHECKHLPYAERLKYLKLPTVKYGWHRDDMIETYKITQGLYDTAMVPN